MNTAQEPLFGGDARKEWPYPDDNTLVGRTEEAVRILARKVAEDAAQLTKAVVGRDGRGFGTQKLTPEEQRTYYDLLREADDPVQWLEQLRSGSASKVVRSWVKLEEERRSEQQ